MLFRRRRNQPRSPDRGVGWNAHEQLALRDPAALNEKQRRLIAFGWLRQEINNGGFSQYFFNSSGGSAPDAVAAAEAMGVGDLARLLSRAMAVLGDPYPLDPSLRQQRVEEVEYSGGEPFEPFDQEYYRLEAGVDFDAAMDGFVRRHPDDFGP